MTFGDALVKIKTGPYVIARACWEPDTFVLLVTVYTATLSGPEEHKEFCLRKADKKYMGWLPSFDDIMADDWILPKITFDMGVVIE